jgi:hypothetical protein
VIITTSAGSNDVNHSRDPFIFFYLRFVYRILSQLKDREHLCQTIFGFPSHMMRWPLKRKRLGFKSVIGITQAEGLLGSGSLQLRVVTWTIADGQTDGQMVRRWLLGRPWLGRIVASIMKLPGVNARVRADANTSAQTCSRLRGRATFTPWMPRDLERLHKGSSNIPFSLPSSPWPGEAMVCLVHFVVWAAIGGSFFCHTCCCCAYQFFLYSAFWRPFQGRCCSDYNDEDPC